jgi:uncharacterized membrane protein YgcG
MTGSRGKAGKASPESAAALLHDANDLGEEGARARERADAAQARAGELSAEYERAQREHEERVRRRDGESVEEFNARVAAQTSKEAEEQRNKLKTDAEAQANVATKERAKAAALADTEARAREDHAKQVEEVKRQNPTDGEKRYWEAVERERNDRERAARQAPAPDVRTYRNTRDAIREDRNDSKAVARDERRGDRERGGGTLAERARELAEQIRSESAAQAARLASLGRLDDRQKELEGKKGEGKRLSAVERKELRNLQRDQARRNKERQKIAKRKQAQIRALARLVARLIRQSPSLPASAAKPSVAAIAEIWLALLWLLWTLDLLVRARGPAAVLRLLTLGEDAVAAELASLLAPAPQPEMDGVVWAPHSHAPSAYLVDAGAWDSALAVVRTAPQGVGALVSDADPEAPPQVPLETGVPCPMPPCRCDPPCPAGEVCRCVAKAPPKSPPAGPGSDTPTDPGKGNGGGGGGGGNGGGNGGGEGGPGGPGGDGHRYGFGEKTNDDDTVTVAGGPEPGPDGDGVTTTLPEPVPETPSPGPCQPRISEAEARERIARIFATMHLEVLRLRAAHARDILRVIDDLTSRERRGRDRSPPPVGDFPYGASELPLQEGAGRRGLLSLQSLISHALGALNDAFESALSVVVEMALHAMLEVLELLCPDRYDEIVAFLASLGEAVADVGGDLNAVVAQFGAFLKDSLDVSDETADLCTEALRTAGIVVGIAAFWKALGRFAKKIGDQLRRRRRRGPDRDGDRERKRSGLPSEGLPRPSVTDPTLQNAVEQLYRPGAKVGSGSTADAIRHELATGARVGGKSHIQKGQEYVRHLEDWLKKSPTASASDRAAAQAILDDLRNALGGK